ncbi:methyltransferas-like protein [Patellaria atrata CBS 101060]|uniref:Methyltransferas-like protein n=1 Tax=Patellaria atrata CBS 101060 TaxID=1346257 RepID=A0A9P4SFI7_9PEZI|nr:methyltransferas-like protein [Patellaria atrata CBS 101060]
MDESARVPSVSPTRSSPPQHLSGDVPPPLQTVEDSIGPEVQSDVHNTDDADSAYDPTPGNVTETTSLASVITKYREENGRTYHAYGSTEHWGPNDARAQDQQDLSHHLWLVTLDNKLFLAPVENPQRILDLGCGTGIWAMDVAEQYPNAQVKGIELSPIQPTWTPPNAIFEIDDYNLDWLDENKFDLIHARELLGSCPDWVELYKKALKALKPGGWFDQAEPSLFFTSDHIDLPQEHCYTQWGRLMLDAGEKSGMTFNIGPYLKEWMEEAGFVNVTMRRVAWPIGKWAKNKSLQEIGFWNQQRLDAGIQDFCSRRFHNKLGVGTPPDGMISNS